jgi:hypothetical protein
MRSALLALTLMVVVAGPGFGQGFHFGINGGVTTGQLDGDGLSGFNKVGYHAALVGGYSISDAHWITVELQNTSYGSRLKNEDVEMNLEADLNSVNVLLAYSLRFGDSWDGVRKFRFMVGPKFNSILKASGPNISEDVLRNSFFAGQATFSYVPSDAVMIDLSYTHALQNILTEELPGTDSLVPYYLTLGLTFYFFK